MKKSSRKRYENNSEKINKKARILREDNPQKAREPSRKYKKNNPEKIKESARKYRKQCGGLLMYENKSSSQYIGIVVAERLIKHLFNDVEMMPYGFPGYDMICNKGKKINVKASTTYVAQLKNSTVNRWKFGIDYNKNCDFFLCVAFNNVIDCNPLYAWLIPAHEVNNQSGARISSSTIHKWNGWKMDLDDAQRCCDLMKEKNKKNLCLEPTMLA